MLVLTALTIIGTLTSSNTPLNKIPVILSAEQQARLLGQQSSISLELGHNLRKQPVLIIPQNAKPIELIRSLAFALHATLEQDGNILKIIRTEADERALKLRDKKVVSDSIRSMLASWDADSQQSKGLGNMASQVAQAIRSDAQALSSPASIPGSVNTRGIDPSLLSPVGHLMRRVIDRLSIDDLSDIDPGSAKVFSNEPTSTEIGIQNTDELLKQFAQDQQAFAQDPALQLSDRDKELSHDAFVLPKPKVNLNGLKYILTVGRNSHEMRFILAVFNDSGQAVAFAGAMTRPRNNPLPQQRTAIAASQNKDSFVDLTPEQLTFDKAVHSPYEPIPTTDPLWQKITHPKSYDPANIFIPTALGPWLSADEKPIVAVIPDELTLAAYHSVIGRRLNIAAFEALLSNSTERLEQDGIRILRPHNPASSDRYTCDRANLESTLQRFIRQGQIDLRGWSLMAFEQDAAFDLLPKQFIGVLRRSINLPEFIDTNRYFEVFQMLGAIPEDNWNSVENGTTITLNDDKLHSLLWQYVMNHSVDSSFLTNQPEISQTPTELFPNGLPSDARLTVRLGPEQVVVRSGSKTDNHSPIGDIDLLTWVDNMHNAVPHLSKPLPKQASPNNPTLDEFCGNTPWIPCVRNTIEADIDLIQGIKLSFVFHSPAREIGMRSGISKMAKYIRDAAYTEWARLDQAELLAPHGN